MRPAKDYVSYIIDGISGGFHIGFNLRSQLQPPPANILTKNTVVTSEYVQQEVLLGRMWKHEVPVKEHQVHISQIGAILKWNKPGKLRLIVDLLSPPGASVNDGISPDLSTVSYMSVDYLSSLVLSVGRGAFLVKTDIKEAYRMLPIHTHDQALLGVQWEGVTYTDLALPFGLRSAPKSFLLWLMPSSGS